jgi:hypothetical protein
MTIWLVVRLVYFGSGIPSWRQILRANRSAISVWRGTVVYPARVGQIYILAVLPSFLGKNTIKTLQVPDQFPPFHLYLELLDYHFALRKFR